MMEQQQFWVIWRENGGTPTCKHYDVTAAKQEAERLARANPGSRFFVLQALACCEHQAVVWHSISDGIPF